MTVPNINLSNFNTLLFTAGLFLFAFVLWQKKSKLDETKKYNQDLILANEEIVHYSKEYQLLADRMKGIVDAMDSLSKIPTPENKNKINLLNSKFDKLNKNTKNIQDILGKTYIKSNTISEYYDMVQRTSNSSGDTRMLVISGVLMLIGMIGIQKKSNYESQILKNKYDSLKNHHSDCQSCGMKLNHDINFKHDSDYCTYCYNGTSFNHSNVDLEDFKIEVAEQLTKKGFTEKEISSHLKKMNRLLRWRKKFDWS
ncbi:zinc ribbon domain-containing protein [Aquimarina mytili]|uniref:Putative zinc ribbon domain-containing protein n=1 Tax=Aquimarina mytili TaxID=874423 RepID=A0A936ZYJ5_9FLAO|nr:zinc ribbon domain-containing protein [Aquimarina mytili]MBL0684308.1 hypothetical protein [Aquimarina mytili]